MVSAVTHAISRIHIRNPRARITAYIPDSSVREDGVKFAHRETRFRHYERTVRRGVSCLVYTAAVLDDTNKIRAGVRRVFLRRLQLAQSLLAFIHSS